MSIRPDELPPGQGPQASSPHALPAAVLWDMDGTLIDSEPYWIAAETELVEDHGGSWTHEDGMRLVGLSLEASGEVLAGRVPLPGPQIVEFLVARVAAELRREVPWVEGARELLVAVRDAGVPSALVTMSYRVLADAVVAGAPPGVFAAVVAGDEVERGKPHPEAYLTAAARLGADPQRCVAVEDSPPGITAAMASGARTVGVRRTVPVPARPGLSRIARLDQLGLDGLALASSGETFDLLGVPDDPES